ncbi:hypothetical protein LXL04_031208 [Taraxacum kok-saghyz]
MLNYFGFSRNYNPNEGRGSKKPVSKEVAMEELLEVIPVYLNLSSFQLCADVKKQTVFFLQIADVWPTSSTAEGCRCGPQTADVLASKKQTPPKSVPRRPRADVFMSAHFQKTNSLRRYKSARCLRGADKRGQEELLSKNKQHLKRVLRYLKGMIHHGLFLSRRSSMNLTAFSDSDWGGIDCGGRSTTAYILYLGSNIISWRSARQKLVSRGSTEAEYKALANLASELTWVQNLLHELGISPTQSPTLYCNNTGVIYSCANPIYHSRMKHVALDYHFVREKVTDGSSLHVRHINSYDQLADALTKPLTRAPFQRLRSKIGVSDGSSILQGQGIDGTPIGPQVRRDMVLCDILVLKANRCGYDARENAAYVEPTTALQGGNTAPKVDVVETTLWCVAQATGSNAALLLFSSLLSHCFSLSLLFSPPNTYVSIINVGRNITIPWTTFVGWPDADFSDKIIGQTRVDIKRIEYYNAHLQSLRDAIRDGVRVAGYFAWSLMDNFQWHFGYSIRFGLFYVDYKHGKFTRYPKNSALWFMNFLKNPEHSGQKKLLEGDPN